MKKALIEVDQLFFGYEERAILKNVSFKVNKGEFIGVIGPNGGGKTTLLNLLMGFYKPQKGQILIQGQSPADSLKSIGFVPQTLNFDRLFPISALEVTLMGCLSELNIWGRYPKEAYDRAHEAMEKLGIHHLKDRSFGTLSGGQIQRVLIARALASNPDILFLDEPTASVDAESQEVIFSLLRKLKGDKTLIMVTHHVQSILSDIDRILCVDSTLSVIQPKEVCNHYTLGLYHPQSDSYDL